MKKQTLLIAGIIGSLGIISPSFAQAEQTIQGESQANIEVSGTISEFDPENPEETDPENPEIPDEAWIKVDIPSTVSFTASDASSGAIHSPIYAIRNRSAEGVAVSAAKFASRQTENTLFTGMTLNLVNLDDTAKTISLRTENNDFLEAPQTLMTLAGTANNDELSQQSFQLNGNLPTDFDFNQVTGTTASQSYDLTLHFERVKA
ncbi:hypothetical protein [Enterococcus mundtii]|uniref:WxL domain-containing protein n=1 Tax=Enterococcus mundtii TaxID=53346 RepID=A0A242KFU3_ENTMU|nr:hypothetical protein [Enterococcus mundtii]OTP19939.1 hypothetical protein A5802_003343 [Enterococcus mundtii]